MASRMLRTCLLMTIALVIVTPVPVISQTPAVAASTATAAAYDGDLASHPRVAEALDLLELWLEAYRAYERIPGISAGLVHDQELIWSKGFGYAHRETHSPARPATMYSICSISKLFTSIGVMQLRDGGKLRLDDPITKHVTWFDIGGRDPNAPPITVQNLLTHSSGLPREPDLPYWDEHSFRFATRDEILDVVPTQVMLYQPSSYHQYSNLGLVMAGEVLMALSGQEWGDYITENILGPLGMSDTFTEIPLEHRGGRLASGYGAWGREGERELFDPFLVQGLRPAFGPSSTVEDLAKFASWQFRAHDYETHEVLAPNTLKEMQRVHWTDPDGERKWGLGFSISHTDGKPFVGHGGNCPGYQTQFLTQPGEKVALIVMANALGANTGRVARTAYEIVGPVIRKALKDDGPVEVADPSLEKYVGRYIHPHGADMQILLWDGQLASVSFPSSDPAGSITKLERVGEHAFRPVREDGRLTDTWRFELGPDGVPLRMKRSQNYVFRVR